MLASRAVFGVDAALWTAVAALASPLVAVLFGLILFRIQQQAQTASQRFLTDGVQKLYGALNTLLSIHILNVQIGAHIIRILKTSKRGHPLSPESSQVPHYQGLELESLPFDSLHPVQELIGDKVVLDWMMLAISDVTLEAKAGEFQIRQPVAAYLGSDPSTGGMDVDEVVPVLNAVLAVWEERVGAHFAIMDRLNELARHLARKRPWFVGGFYVVWKRSEIRKIREAMQDGYENAEAVHERTEDLLKSGGAASDPE